MTYWPHSNPEQPSQAVTGRASRNAGNPARRTTRAEERRATLIDEVTAAVDELARQVRTTVLHAQDKGWGADGIHRPAITTRVHRTRGPGLLVQVKAAVGGHGSGWDEDGALSMSRGGKPGSRPPVRVDALDFLADVAAGVRGWRQRLGGRGRRPMVVELRGLVGLARTADDAALRALTADLRSWVRTARISLAYDAPVVDLDDVSCPDCQGVLRVFSDASSDVWCAGGPWPRCVLGSRRERLWTPGCGATWPQGQWVLLLEQTGEPK